MRAPDPRRRASPGTSRGPQPVAQLLLLGAAAGEHQVQPRVALARSEKRVRQQVDAFLLGQASDVEDVDIDAEQTRRAQLRVKAADVDAAVPATDQLLVDAKLTETLVARGAGREDHVTGAVEAAQRDAASASTCAWPVRRPA